MSESKHTCGVEAGKCTCTDANHKHANGKTVCTDCGNERKDQH